MKTLKLLNVVKANVPEDGALPFVSPTGLVIMPEALWAKNEIINYYRGKNLDGKSLNASFHKSWRVIQESSREELLIHQLLHYESTYGTGFSGKIYIPCEDLDIPEIKAVELFIVSGISDSEIQERLLKMVDSGIALDEETQVDILALLDQLGYEFTKFTNNKEFNIRLVDTLGANGLPATEILRYCLYKSTGSTLLIKSNNVVNLIKESQNTGLRDIFADNAKELSKVFNRFKPLFLAYKKSFPKEINRISKLSKKHHVPMVENPLNVATSKLIEGSLEGASTFHLLRAFNALKMPSKYSEKLYLIRNGKSFIKESPIRDNEICAFQNSLKILMELQKRVMAKSYYVPSDVTYSIPTSAKSFVGDVPIGTKFHGKDLVVGVYWRNKWGANDIDLSSLSIQGKVGWNADYKSGHLLFSGDMTDASPEAVEYLYSSNGKAFNPSILKTNIYYGDNDARYAIIIGHGSKPSRKLMMDPNKVMARLHVRSIQKENIIGIFEPNTFMITHMGSGSARISRSDGGISQRALYNRLCNAVSLNGMLDSLGFKKVDTPNESDIDLSLDKVIKETFISIFG